MKLCEALEKYNSKLYSDMRLRLSELKTDIQALLPTDEEIKNIEVILNSIKERLK